MNRYETNQNGTAPALSALLNKFAEMPRSAFDETRRKVLDAFPFGIIPIECFFMFPNSEAYFKYDISCISKNPTIRRMLSSMSIETRTYICKCSDLWEGWNNFITRGRSGKVNLQIPKLIRSHTSINEGGVFTYFDTGVPYNPYSYMNIIPPFCYSANQDIKNNTGIAKLENWEKQGASHVYTGLVAETAQNSDAYNNISALPAVMYCKVAKEYQNPNLLQNNKYWYPENENHDLILPYTCTSAANASYDSPTTKLNDTLDSVKKTEVYPTNDLKSMPWLNVLYYRQRKGNYFNTGSPFPDLIRGDVPTLDVLSANIDFSNVVGVPTNPGAALAAIGYVTDSVIGQKLFPFISSKNIGDFDTSSNADNSQVPNPASAEYEGAYQNLIKTLNKATVKGINFNLNEWRRLAALTVFKERMARTNGSYNQMIQAQFQHNPQWHEHSVKYCGGSSQPIVFSEVVQQSENGNTPLGTTAGRAVSSMDNNEISVHVDDYSIVMTVLTITPDDYYSQGVDRMWSELTQSEQYFPILNNLAPQAIKNKELYISDVDSDNEDVFNYQELFSHFKSRQNQVSGLMALPIDKVGDTGAYIFNRLFDSTPNFNNAFVTGKMTDNENLCFASTEQAQFILSIVSKMKYVAPMPTITQPSDMGLSY